MNVIDLKAHIKAKEAAEQAPQSQAQQPTDDTLNKIIPALQGASREAAETGDPSELINVLTVAVCHLAEQTIVHRDNFFKLADHLGIGVADDSGPKDGV